MLSLQSIQEHIGNERQWVVYIVKVKWYFNTLFLTQYIYRKEKPKEKEEMKMKNIIKLSL
jgi:hypothetical protein